MNDCRQKGQAISEFLVAMAWMVPLFLAFIAIAHMLNAQSTTHEAARYVAWERLAYDGATYNQKMQGGVNGFGAEVTDRFFINGRTGFDSTNNTQPTQWLDWRSKQSVVDTVQGAKIALSEDRDDIAEDQQRLTGLLLSRSGKSSWLDGRGGIELDTSETSELSIAVNVRGNSAFVAGTNSNDLKLSTSYALISDSWAAGSEADFSNKVEASRPRGLTNARTWLQNNGGARRLRNQFAEIDLKLYSDQDDPSNSFSTVSPKQSSALPATLLEEYVE